jgi:hypothetical protein
MTVLYLEALAAIAVSLSVLMAGAWMATIWSFSLGLVGAGSALWPVVGTSRIAAPGSRTTPAMRLLPGNEASIRFPRPPQA